jgi:hypothetical protein
MRTKKRLLRSVRNNNSEFVKAELEPKDAT